MRFKCFAKKMTPFLLMLERGQSIKLFMDRIVSYSAVLLLLKWVLLVYIRISQVFIYQKETYLYFKVRDISFISELALKN